MRSLSARLASITALTFLLTAPGCGVDHEEDHDHDHDHAAHIDPPHWPKDFPDAVDRLLSAQKEAGDMLTAGRSSEVRSNTMPVLYDLAKWLPEVAGDSDMPEEPWNRVNALSDRLRKIYESVLQDFQSGQSVGSNRLAEAEPLLAELRRERDQADMSWFAPLTSGGLSESEVTESIDFETELANSPISDPSLESSETIPIEPSGKTRAELASDLTPGTSN